MSSPEFDRNPIETEEEESTIFTASPTKTAPVKKVAGHKKLKSLISLVLVLLVLGGSILAVVKLIPEKEDEGIAETDNISVLSIAPEKIKSVKITRKDSVSTYLSTVTETTDEETGETSTEVEWSIEGIDPSLTETTAINMVVDTALSLYATRTIDREEDADYGFSDPQYVVELTGYDAADSHTLTIGAETPSQSGVYATLGEEIYLISIEAAEDFATTDEEMATSFAISAATVDADNMDYFTDNALASFDKITLSGKNFPSRLVFEMNEASDSGNYNDYIMTSPVRRYADTANVGGLLDIAVNGLTAAEAYKYNPTAADIKAYGLASPDMKLTIEYGTKRVELKATRADSDYFAVLVTGRENIIFKVANTFLPFAEYEETAFANSLIFIETVTDFSNMTFKTPASTYSFDISYTEETEEEEAQLTVKCGGNDVTAQNFQNFYQYLVVECNEVTLDKYSGTPALTLTAKRADGSSTTLKFIKCSDRRYYVEADSAPIGFISTTNMEKILGYLPQVAENAEIPSIV